MSIPKDTFDGTNCLGYHGEEQRAIRGCQCATYRKRDHKPTEATLYHSQRDEIVADLRGSAELAREWCECSKEMGASCGCEKRAANLERAAELIEAMPALADEETPF